MNLAKGTLFFPMRLSWWTVTPFGHSIWNDKLKTEKVGSPDNVQVLSPEPHLQVTGFHRRPGPLGSKKKGRTDLLVLPIGEGVAKNHSLGDLAADCSFSSRCNCRSCLSS